MTRLARILFLAGILLTVVAAPIQAQSRSVDTAASQKLTDYLRKHRLPLVGAQVTQDSSGGIGQVMLYGYVATDFGKRDAEKKTRNFLKQPNVEIVNRIQVRPEIRSLKPKPAAVEHKENPPPESQEQQNATKEYMNQGNHGPRPYNQPASNPDPWAEILQSFSIGIGLP